MPLTEEEREVWMRAPWGEAKALQRRCPTMRSGSSGAVWTRKTKPPHEIRRLPPLRRPKKAARRILEIAHAVEPIKAAFTSLEINEPFLFPDRGSPTEYGAGLKLTIERGWLKMHESGTFVTFTPAGAELFV